MDSPLLGEVVTGLAPGAWAATLAALLCLALGRWYDRVPRRVLAVFALVLVVLFGEVLFGGAVLLPLDNLRGETPFRGLRGTDPHGNLLQGDLLYMVHPLRREVRRSVASGEWPLWAPHLGAGMPLLADPQAQALQPLAAAGLALDPLAAPAAVAALRTFVALVFAYLLLARLGAGRGPALAGSLAYGLGGFLQLWLGWPLANTAALLPAVLYALVRASEAGLRRDRVLLILTLAALLLAGHPETVVYALLLATGLFLARLRGLPGGERRAFAVRAVAAAALAACLAAPALLPFAAHLPHTVRWSRTVGAGAPPDTAPGLGGDDPPPATRLVQVAVPNALGNDRFAHYWGVSNSNEDAAGFVGTAALLAALLALPGWLAGPRPLRHEGAALVVAAGCLLVLALPAGAFGRVPPGGLSGRVALPLGLSLAALTAATVERFRHRELPRWLPLAALPAAVLLLAALHLWAVPALARPGDPETLAVLREGWLHWHLRFLGGAAVLLAASRLLGRRRRWAAWGVATLVAAELLLAHRPVNPPMPRRLAFPDTPAVAALRGAARDPGAATRVAGIGAAFLPNLGAVYGLADARIFDPMAPAPYLALLGSRVESWRGEIPLLAAPTRPGDWTLTDRLGIGAWMTAPEAPCPAGTEEVYAGRDARVCRRHQALQVMRATGGARIVSAAEVPGGDRWSLQVAADTGGEVETGIYAAPGWRVLADGRPVRRRQATLLAAALPPGTRRADLVYRPTPFVAGCLLAALGVALLATWLAPPPAVAPAADRPR